MLRREPGYFLANDAERSGQLLTAAPASPELIAAHFRVSEDGRRLYVLSAYEDSPADVLRFRPYRGLARVSGTGTGTGK